MMLAVAYASSIGGIGTLVGTPPNIVLVHIHAKSFPNEAAISFSKWLIMAFPLVVVFLCASFSF